VPLNYL